MDRAKALEAAAMEAVSQWPPEPFAPGTTADEILEDPEATALVLRTYLQTLLDARATADLLATKAHVIVKVVEHPDCARHVAGASLDFLRKAGHDENAIVAEIANLAFASLGDFLDIDTAGNAVLDLAGVPSHKMRAVQEITQEVYMEGHGDDAVPVKRTKIKLYDKLRGLEALAKIAGLLQNNVNVSGSVEHTHRREAERALASDPAAIVNMAKAIVDAEYTEEDADG